MTPTPDHTWGPPAPPAQPARPRLGRRLALATGIGAVLAVGGVAIAQAAAAPSPSASAPSASPSASGSTAPEAPRERTPRLAGTVVSASGSTIVITDRQGFQRTIRTSSATEYEDGLTATPAAGTRILAAGTVADDRTSLDATRIARVPDRVAERGWPGHRHGGPGHRDRPGEPDPSATPSPSPTR